MSEDGLAFLTPDLDGSASVECRTLALPSFLWPYFNGAYGELVNAENWFQFGDMTPEEVAAIFQDAFDNMVTCP